MGRRGHVVLSLVLLASFLAVVPAGAASIGNAAFQATWARTDQPVATGAVSRTWMWGPQADSGLMTEPYTDAPGGARTVQYFDKSRMEINDPHGDPTSIWYVTNGLLARELITGQMQSGANTFQQRAPAQVNVAGDPDDQHTPTYATFAPLLGATPLANGAAVVQTLDRSGTVGSNGALASYGVTATDVGAPTNHPVASPLWAFMNSTGLVSVNGQNVTDRLFVSPFYATGFPITEAYWTRTKVAGTVQDVLVQCFERRCLTYTPSNPAGWQVEMGNIGRHYYAWRYGTPPTQVAGYRLTQPLAATAGVSVTATITAVDGNGNTVTSAQNVVYLSSSTHNARFPNASCGGTLGPTSCQVFLQNGTASFTVLDLIPETTTVQVQDGNGAGASALLIVDQATATPGVQLRISDASHAHQLTVPTIDFLDTDNGVLTADNVGGYWPFTVGTPYTAEFDATLYIYHGRTLQLVNVADDIAAATIEPVPGTNASINGGVPFLTIPTQSWQLGTPNPVQITLMPGQYRIHIVQQETDGIGGAGDALLYSEETPSGWAALQPLPAGAFTLGGLP